jgi:hypothetical protein
MAIHLACWLARRRPWKNIFASPHYAPPHNLPRFLQARATSLHRPLSLEHICIHPTIHSCLLAKTIRRQRQFHPHKLTSACLAKSTVVI